VAVWRAVIPRAQEPPTGSSRDRSVRVGLLEARGEVIQDLAGDGLDAATRGASLVVTDDLAGLPPDAEAGDEVVVWYAVRSRCCRNRWSRFSNIVRVIPDDLPPPPQQPTATADADGIHLEWTANEEQTVRVERSPDGETWETVAPAVAGAEWTDAEAAQGRLWLYRLRGVDETTGADSVRVGPATEPISVDHPDRYAPDPPEELVCLPEGSRVRLRWRAAADASAYEIRRETRGAAPSESVVATTDGVSYVDESPPTGNVSYFVASVDEAGNSSQPARCDTVVEEQP
jgi:hypothetical protein